MSLPTERGTVHFKFFQGDSRGVTGVYLCTGTFVYPGSQCTGQCGPGLGEITGRLGLGLGIGEAAGANDLFDAVDFCVLCFDLFDKVR